MLRKIFAFVLIIMLVLGLVQFTISTATASNALNVLPPEGKYYGLSYPEHIQNFWKWIIAIPVNDNPIIDTSGVKCSIDQMNTNSSVFYLAPTDSGKAEERTCKVPVDKALFIPIMPEELSDKEQTGSPEELATSVKTEQNRVDSLYLKIDNTEYKMDNLTKYRTATDPFVVTFPDFPQKGIFGVSVNHNESGNSTAVADGYYILTEPLAKGNHVIQFKSNVGPDDTGSGQWGQEVTYKIIVE